MLDDFSKTLEKKVGLCYNKVPFMETGESPVRARRRETQSSRYPHPKPHSGQKPLETSEKADSGASSRNTWSAKILKETPRAPAKRGK